MKFVWDTLDSMVGCVEMHGAACADASVEANAEELGIMHSPTGS